MVYNALKIIDKNVTLYKTNQLFNKFS